MSRIQDDHTGCDERSDLLVRFLMSCFSQSGLGRLRKITSGRKFLGHLRSDSEDEMEEEEICEAKNYGVQLHHHELQTDSENVLMASPDTFDQPSTSDAFSHPSKFAVDQETSASPGTVEEELRCDFSFVDVNLYQQDQDENLPSTSSASGNTGEWRRDISACFPSVYQEKYSKYQINHLTSRPPAEFLILNSVRTSEQQAFTTKLFVPAGAFPDSCWLRDAAWTKVWLSFHPSREKPEFVIGQFSDSSFQFRCCLPEAAGDLQDVLQTCQPFMLSETRLLQMLQFYRTKAKSFCSILTRHGRSHQTYETASLGYEWIKLMFSKAERHCRLHSLFKSDPWFTGNKLNVSLIESQVFSEVDSSILLSSHQFINYNKLVEIKNIFQKYETDIHLKVDSRKQIIDENKKDNSSSLQPLSSLPVISSVVSLAMEEPQDQNVVVIDIEEDKAEKSHLDSCKLKSLPNFLANSSVEDSIQIDDDDDDDDDDEVIDDQEIVLSSDDDTGSFSIKPNVLRDDTVSQEVIKLDEEETFDAMFGIVREEEEHSDQFSQLDLPIQTTKRRLSNEDNLSDNNKGRKTNVDISEEQARDQTGDEEYFYFCLDCESHLSGNCPHMSHPRVPIGIDIAEHFSTRGHSRLQTIADCVMPIKERRLLALQNVSYSKTWSSRVRKCWKKMVLSGDLTSVKYESNRRCLSCEFRTDNAVDMFLHIKSHL